MAETNDQTHLLNTMTTMKKNKNRAIEITGSSIELKRHQFDPKKRGPNKRRIRKVKGTKSESMHK